MKVQSDVDLSVRIGDIIRCIYIPQTPKELKREMRLFGGLISDLDGKKLVPQIGTQYHVRSIGRNEQGKLFVSIVDLSNVDGVFTKDLPSSLRYPAKWFAKSQK